MRPRRPDGSGVITRDGVRVAYDVYGEGNSPTVLLLPAWSIVHAEHWKFQVPVLARRHRVITIDGRGNGRSDRPTDPAAYTVPEYVADAVAVLDATGTGRAVIAGLSRGGLRAIALAAGHPDRVLGAVVMCPTVDPLSSEAGAVPDPRDSGRPFTDDPSDAHGWALYNQHVWRRDYRKFLDFFWKTVFPEPHSTKAVEDATGWALETDPEVLIATVLAPPWAASRDELTAQIKSVRCPVLLVHGTDDAVIPADRSREIADLTGGDLLLIEGAGHCPQARDPIVVNRALLEFIDRVTPPAERAQRRSTWTRARSRPKKIIYLSSPIGLGHARRDVAIAAELRKLHDDVQIDWLAQHPVTTVLAASGEHVHPASAFLASESAHVEDEAGEHDLHAFQAIRRMDEILVANFTLLQDVVERGDYDLVIGDEAWDLDYFWHENPEPETGRLRLDDRLRRLAADARGRRARGHADRRLQRADDRAYRPLRADPGPVDLRRRAGRHRAGRVRSRVAIDQGLDAAALRLRRLHHRHRPGGQRPGSPSGPADRDRGRRRIGRRDGPAAEGRRGVPYRPKADRRPADDRRRRAADRSGAAARARRARGPRLRPGPA